ncbi:hypothetical protein BH11PSE11_BH11PSE11_08350 [soil metagenome]
MKFATQAHAAPAHVPGPVSRIFPDTSRPWSEVLLSFLIILKPLALGIVRATMTAFNPQLPLRERLDRQRLRDTLMLNRMAREADMLQPGLAAELRSFAGRD